MPAEILGGISALKSAFDIARTLKDMDDTAKRNAAIIDLQQTILDAQAAQQEALKKAEALEGRVKELENWEAERQEYTRYPAAPGLFTYAHTQESCGEVGTFPQLCPSCFHHRHKSFLNTEDWNPGRCEVLVCRDCGWHAYVVGSAEPEHQKLAPRPYRGN
ncbi:hypothetical protein [Bradyrhizobium sp. AUGA SZCCT0160]|uniref:hypothetical protein n=1 Tax=Bradyrhizobium sp. AUGA SZCCT0160 TaxID=2807662 RepID=UPI001BA553D1|nr:hypothetical protein [Bradyrhizobium sp. AUGA SZCCT0160]MBR1193267.1 hypothetical protein [Bradyrhizobium sp. AUGA SZCCT0160]